jgi:hypothetical protein
LRESGFDIETGLAGGFLGAFERDRVGARRGVGPRRDPAAVAVAVGPGLEQVFSIVGHGRGAAAGGD